MTGAPRDFIAIGLGEIESRDVSRMRIARIQWLGLLVLAAIITLIVILLVRTQSTPVSGGDNTEITTRLDAISKQVNILIERGTPNLLVGRWATGAFDEGQFECKVNKQGKNPCTSATSGMTAIADTGLKTLLQDPRSGQLIILVEGRHDRTPLSSALQQQIGSNIQLAQMRADAVGKLLLEGVAEERKKSLWIITTTRGASDLTLANAVDRAVVVRAIRIQAS